MSADGRPGEIVTFYSYKGGTGRSMLLANVAWILASNGKRVLVLDWDLEAPGIHRYFQPFLADPDLTASEGIIDFVIDFSLAALASGGEDSESSERWFAPYANVLRYASSLAWDFPEGGTLDFVGAGRQGPSYSTRVNSFDWQAFYDRFGGGAFLEETKRQVKERYEYVLVDSRTGVSDTAGICTLQLPDTLVVCFTLNNQSIEGAAAVATSVHEQRRREQPVRILPVPMRIENSEKTKLELRKSYARGRFGQFPEAHSGEEVERYWADVEVLYVPFYAYEEILATFGDRPDDRHSVLASAERLTSLLSGGEVTRAVRPSESRRLEVLAAYEGRSLRPPVPADAGGGGIYISYRRQETAGFAGRLYDQLSEHFGEERVFSDIAAISPGLDFADSIEQAVHSASVMLVLIGPDWHSRIDDPADFVRHEVATALAGDARVIPVLVDGARMPPPDALPPDIAPLARRNALELNSLHWREGVRSLVSAVELALAADRVAASGDFFRRPARARDAERAVSELDDLLTARERLRSVRLVAVVSGLISVVSVLVLLVLLLR